MHEILIFLWKFAPTRINSLILLPIPSLHNPPMSQRSGYYPSCLELGQYFTAVCLDVEQAFNPVWHEGLLSKLQVTLPSTYFLTLKSYLSNSHYQASLSNSIFSIHPMCVGIPQGSILGPFLYTIYTADIPTQPSTILSTFADDICILSPHIDPHQVSKSLQNHLQVLEDWFRKWRIKINEVKSTQITFTLRKSVCPPYP